MGDFRIFYNGKSIDLPKLPNKHTLAHSVILPLTSNPKTYRDGRVVRELEPRVDVRFSCAFMNLSPQHLGGSEAMARRLRVRLENFWIWLQRSGAASVAWDSARTVNTTLSVAGAAGDNQVRVVAGAGIQAGRYRLLGSRAKSQANRYQLLNVTAVNGQLVTVSDALDYGFGAGAHFIDEFYFPAVALRDFSDWPFDDGGELPGWFNFKLAFYLGPLS